MKRLLLIALAMIFAVPAFAEGVWSNASEGGHPRTDNPPPPPAPTGHAPSGGFTEVDDDELPF